MLREILTEMKLMRSLLLSAVLLMTVFAAQAQQNYGIAYQAVARDADGDALENATLDFRFTLTDAADAAIWTETHNAVVTDEFGLINLTIGSVEGSSALASVDWASGGFAFQVEVNSGDGFDPFGSISVSAAPVSLFASSAPEPKADSLAVVTAQEAVDRASADNGLQGQIDGNDADIATNAGAIGTNATAISDESSARAAADSGLQGQIDGNDADIATNAGAISTNATAISDEASARAAADTDLQGNLDAEATARFNNDSFISGMLSANSAADAAVEARVSALENESTSAALDAVDSLDTAHSAEILANTSGLSDESAARIAADTGLQTQIDGNDSDISTNASGISTNATAISTNATAISDEASARTAADSGLQGQIDGNDADIATNAGAISTNTTAISDETTDRINADADLQTQIDNLPTSVPSIGAVVEDLLDGTQEGAGLNADGSYVQKADANYISTATSLATADDLLDAAIKAVQDDVDQNESDSDQVEADLQTELDGTQTGAGLGADGAYTANAAGNHIGVATSLVNADDLLDAAIKAVQDDVDGNESDADTAISGVQDDVDQNESDSDQADADFQTELDGTQTGAGLGADGAYAANAAANYIDAATSLVNADDLLDAQAKANADEILATDYFDQTDVTLHAGAGETWTGIETADGSFTTGVSTGTMTASGNATVGGTLGVTGAATLSSTLDVTGAAELDDALGVDGSVRIGTSGASKFSVDATTGTATLTGDVVALTGGIASGSLTITGSSTLQNVSASSLSVSGLITVPTPSLGSAAANKSYVDGAISTAMTTPQAYSYLSSGTYTGLGADLGAGAVTVTVTGANLAAGTYKLHLDGNEATLTVTVNSATEIEFDVTDADVSALTSRTGLLAAQLSIDGEATGLNIFVNL